MVQGTPIDSVLYMAGCAAVATSTTISRQYTVKHRDSGKVRGYSGVASQYKKSSRMKSPVQ